MTTQNNGSMTALEAGLEAVLFAAGDAVTIERLSAALEVAPAELLDAAAALENRYDFENRGIMLLRIEDKLQLASRPMYGPYVRRVTESRRPPALSLAALEVLTIIAYRQPVTRAEIEAIRGVNADGAISRLTEKELIFISGRADLPGRPLQYSTTQNFLDYIGVNSLEELPASDVLSPNQISEWIKRASSPAEIKDKEMGLPQEESLESGADGSSSGLDSEYSAQAEASERAQTPSDRKIESDFGDVPREVEVPAGASHFPYDGAESAGSQEEFEPAPDDGGEHDGETPKDKAEI